jgi:hypothetical protein
MMPRISTGEPKVRLNLELTDRVRARLEYLRAETQADTLVEVVRRALAIYDTLLSVTRDRGDAVILRSKDGTERELIIA